MLDKDERVGDMRSKFVFKVGASESLRPLRKSDTAWHNESSEELLVELHAGQSKASHPLALKVVGHTLFGSMADLTYVHCPSKVPHLH